MTELKDQLGGPLYSTHGHSCRNLPSRKFQATIPSTARKCPVQYVQLTGLKLNYSFPNTAQIKHDLCFSCAAGLFLCCRALIREWNKRVPMRGF